MSANPYTLTAAVCTFNRAESLRDTLVSLAAQTLPAGALDILVVDNNSTDHTRQVVDDAARQSRWSIRRVVEPQQGIAHARNRALAEAKGACVAFIDDDAVAQPGWCAAIVRCFEETRADVVGGRVMPRWLGPRPSWLTEDLLGPITAMDHGPARKRCTTETFLTTNCALRRAQVPGFGAFDVTLGRRGTRWVGGEDFELCQRWAAKGAVIVYEPSAVVEHKVLPERVTPEFYRRWFTDIGYTQGHQLAWKWHYRTSVLPLWRWAALASAGLRYVRTRIARASADRQLRAELWWRFERSFLAERMDHWRARWMPAGARACRFANAR